MTAKITKKAAPRKAAKKRTSKKATAKRAAKPKAPAKTKSAPKATPAKTDAPAKKAPPTRERDPRLPKPGAVLTRTFQGKEIQVEVLDAGFRYDGKVWRSLSGIAKAITQTPWNGYLFFGLQKRPAKPTQAEPKDGAA